MKLHFTVVKLPDASTPSSDHIVDNLKFASYFSNCMRVFDSTHINMHFLEINQPHYQNRK